MAVSPAGDTPEVTVLMPCCNEATTIGAGIEEAVAVAPRAGWRWRW